MILSLSHQPAYAYLSAKRLGEASRTGVLKAFRKGADLQLRRLGNEITQNYNGIMDIVLVSRITAQRTTLAATQSRGEVLTLQDGSSNGRLGGNKGTHQEAAATNTLMYHVRLCQHALWTRKSDRSVLR